MNIPSDQIIQLKKVFPLLQIAEEGGYPYILLSEFELDQHCIPRKVDLLLAPSSKDGYNSNLYFSAEITGIPSRNWNRRSVRILGRNWFAMSWATPPNQTLIQMLLTHLKALK